MVGASGALVKEQALQLTEPCGNPQNFLGRNLSDHFAILVEYFGHHPLTRLVDTETRTTGAFRP